MRQQTRRNVRGLIGTAACVLALSQAALGAVVTLIFGGPAIVLEAVGILFGIIGFSLGRRKLAITAIVVCVVVMFVGLAVSQGLLPGTEISPVGRDSVGSI